MKRSITIVLSAAIALSLSSCASSTNDDTAAVASMLTAYEASVQALEDKLAAVQQLHEQLKTKNEGELEDLKAQLEELRKQEAEQGGDPDTPDKQPEEALDFNYIVSDGVASITGYTGDEKKIVVPSSIGGYRVSSIADGAFEGSALTDVVIADGIERIGWFAFRDCASLKSLTIPSSVDSIGYGALGDAQSSPFIYCHADSFALAYSKSYGLSYAVI